MKSMSQLEAKHSTWQMLVQVMKSSRRFPLTGGRWVYMWLKNAKIEMFRRGYLTNKFSKCKNDPMGPSNLEFLDRFPNMAHVFSKFQVIKIWQCYIEAIFNPKSSQKVLKIARFWNIVNQAFCDWFLHIHGLLLMRRVYWNCLKVILSLINCKMMH